MDEIEIELIDLIKKERVEISEAELAKISSDKRGREILDILNGDKNKTGLYLRGWYQKYKNIINYIKVNN